LYATAKKKAKKMGGLAKKMRERFERKWRRKSDDKKANDLWTGRKKVLRTR